MKMNTNNPQEFMKDSEEESKIKERIAAKEVKEAQLLRNLRAVRGEIEEEKRKLGIKTK